MYERITGEDPYAVPMRIYPAVHYTMGGLWVDYDLQSTIPGLFVIGEANFSDHGANRLGASALMQGLADGYFVLPNTIGNYLAAGPFPTSTRDHAGGGRGTRRPSRTASTQLLAVNGDRTVDSFHRELGHIMWEYCGMERTEEGLSKAIGLIRGLRDEFWTRVKVPGTGEQLNQNLEKAGRVADFFELAELMCIDALHRARVCRRPLPRREPDPRRRGAAPRRRVQLRRGLGVHGATCPVLHKEHLDFEYVHPSSGATSNGHPGARLAPAGPVRPRADGHLRRRRTSPPTPFLEMLDVLNEKLILDGDDPVAFDHDCREGICGMCGMMINGVAHGPERATTTCQLHMRHFTDGDTIDVEPWRAAAFPVIKDLVVDRSAFDTIIQAGGYITAPTGAAPDAHAIPVPKADADAAFEAATCIGCGACVAACPNGSAMLFTAAKVAHLGLLPQGQPERDTRVLDMIEAQDEAGFGGCTNTGECTAVCPKGIPLTLIGRLNTRLPQEPQSEVDHRRLR